MHVQYVFFFLAADVECKSLEVRMVIKQFTPDRVEFAKGLWADEYPNCVLLGMTKVLDEHSPLTFDGIKKGYEHTLRMSGINEQLTTFG